MPEVSLLYGVNEDDAVNLARTLENYGIRAYAVAFNHSVAIVLSTRLLEEKEAVRWAADFIRMEYGESQADTGRYLGGSD